MLGSGGTTLSFVCGSEKPRKSHEIPENSLKVDWWSPGIHKMHKNLFTSMFLFHLWLQSIGFPYTPPNDRKQQRISPSNSSSQDGAPPTESLYSNNFLSGSVNEVETLRRSVLNTTNQLAPRQLSQSTLNNGVFGTQAETLPQSPAQMDPFYSQGKINLLLFFLLSHFIPLS